jgi:hypothetical protein
VALDWHVDVCDREGLALHHAGFTLSISDTFLVLTECPLYESRHPSARLARPLCANNRHSQALREPSP